MAAMSSDTVEQALAACAIIIERPITWGAMDAYQHVNNTIYFRYFEDVRIAYFEAAALLPQAEETSVGPILAETWCRFKAPLTYPDTVRIGARITEIGADRFAMEYVVASQRLDRVAAVGGGVVVSYDYRAGKKAPLPPAWRQVLARPKLGAAGISAPRDE